MSYARCLPVHKQYNSFECLVKISDLFWYICLLNLGYKRQLIFSNKLYHILYFFNTNIMQITTFTIVAVIMVCIAIITVNGYPYFEDDKNLMDSPLFSMRQLFELLLKKRRDNTNFTSYYLFFHILSRYFKCT